MCVDMFIGDFLVINSKEDIQYSGLCLLFIYGNFFFFNLLLFKLKLNSGACSNVNCDCDASRHNDNR